MPANRLEAILSTTITLAIVVMAGVIVRREIRGARPASGAAQPRPPRFISTWKSVGAVGATLGDASAPVKLVEFSDLECPYCKRFHEERLPLIRQEFGARVAVVFVHFPLPMHRFARPAARVAECAGAQGRFAEFVGIVFQKQDSLGLKSWGDYAREAGVQDSARFLACAKDQAPVAAIDAGSAAGARLGVHGTPTIMINGWLFDSPPDDTTLLRDIHALLEGRSPQ